MEEKEIFVTTDDNKKLQGEILFTFEANGDNFILYSLEGEDHIFASKVDEEGNLDPVEEDEWKLIEKVYQQYLEDMERNNDN